MYEEEVPQESKEEASEALGKAVVQISSVCFKRCITLKSPQLAK